MQFRKYFLFGAIAALAFAGANGRTHSAQSGIGGKFSVGSSGNRMKNALSNNLWAQSKVKRSSAIENGRKLDEVELGVYSSGYAYELGLGAVEFCVQAVYAASIAANGGKVVATGTLTVKEDGSAAYSASPADRLVVVLPNGGAVSFVVRGMEGDFSGSPEHFMKSPYGIDFSISATGAADLSVQYVQSGNDGANSAGQLQGAMKGTMDLNGTSCSVDLKLGGQWKKEVDSGFAGLEITRNVQGTISGGGMTQTVSETNWSNIVVFQRTVENYRRTANNSWSVGSKKYSLSNLLIQKEFTDSKIAEPDYWRASGTLTRNGNQIGQVALTMKGGHAAVILTADGKQIVMEQH